MARRPDDETPTPPGGRAAERLRDFLNRRLGQGDEPPEPPPAQEEEQPAEEDPGH